jgi:hypothetical protein
MSRKLVATSAVFALAMLGFAGFASPAAALAGDTIVVTSTIQAAVDAAQRATRSWSRPGPNARASWSTRATSPSSALRPQ